MPLTHVNPWSKENTQATLQQLREDYPRYSDNELYVIWCKITGHIPFDKHGKIDQAMWEIHAVEDGQFTPAGNFKVSRPLYGRALKAKLGKAKPKNAARGSRRQKEEAPPRLDPFMSKYAMAFAADYDRASKTLELFLTQRREISQAVDQLRRFPRGLLAILAEESQEAREALERHELA